MGSAPLSCPSEQGASAENGGKVRTFWQRPTFLVYAQRIPSTRELGHGVEKAKHCKEGVEGNDSAFMSREV